MRGGESWRNGGAAQALADREWRSAQDSCDWGGGWSGGSKPMFAPATFLPFGLVGSQRKMVNPEGFSSEARPPSFFPPLSEGPWDLDGIFSCGIAPPTPGDVVRHDLHPS